jgi:hypothetical protein
MTKARIVIRFGCAVFVLVVLCLLAWQGTNLTGNSLLPIVLAPILLAFYLTVSNGMWKGGNISDEVKQAPPSMKSAYCFQLQAFRYAFCYPGHFVCSAFHDVIRLLTSNKSAHGTR